MVTPVLADWAAGPLPKLCSVEVTVKLEAKNGEVYTGRSASLDVVEASAKAYLNAINKLVHYEEIRGSASGVPRDKAIL